MQHNRSSKILVLTGLLAILTAGASAAAPSISVTQADKVIWAHQGKDTSVSGSYECSSGGATLKYTTADGVTFSQDYQNNTGEFSRTFDLATLRDTYGYGLYDIDLTCGDSSTDSTSFNVKHFTVSKKSPTGKITAYRGNSFTLTLTGAINSNPVKLGESNTDLRAELIDGPSVTASFAGNNDNDTLVDVSIPESTSPGEYTLVLRTEYQKEGGIQKQVNAKVEVRPTWETKILETTEEDGQLTFQELSDWNARVQVNESGEPFNGPLRSEDFYVTIRDADENNSVVGSFSQREFIDSTWQGAGKYDIQFSTIPNLPLGRYNFEIGVDKTSNGVPVTDLTVSRYILFSGQITDSAGKPVNGEIFVEKEGFQRRVKVQNGKYSDNVLPGNYNFTLNLPEAQLSLQGVSLKSSENTVQDGKAVGTIRYDDIPLNTVSDELEGVTVANAVAVWFGYPFENGKMTLQYDTTKVNPSNLRVYECVGWNLNGVSCYQGASWEEVGVKRSWIHPTVGTVTFPVTPYNVTGTNQLLNGYMVVKNTPMNLQYLEFQDSDLRVPKGGDLTLNGKVVTPSGEGIRGAQISVKFVDTSTGSVVGGTTSARSGQNGVFSVTKAVPNENGNYQVIIEGEKKPYTGFSQKIQQTFETFTQKQITLTGPDTATFYVGADSSTEFTISNSGQAPLNDVKISVRNLNNNWYSFKKSSWNRLQPGDTVRAVMVTNVPKSQCPSGTCQDYQQMTVEVTSRFNGARGPEDASQVTAQISRNAPDQVNSSSQDSKDGGGLSAPSLPNTGEFLERQGSVNIALGLIIVFTLVLATAIKKKNSSSDDRSRPVSSGGEMRKAKPNVSGSPSSNGESGSEDVEESGEEDSEEGDEDEGEEESFECSVCGEEFDTESARDLHEQAIHD